jgi:hypothetical protein
MSDDAFWTAARQVDKWKTKADAAADRIAALEVQLAELTGALTDVVEMWDWWNVDQYDRDQSAVSDAIDAARDLLTRAGIIVGDND